MINCRTLNGQIKPVPAERVSFRPGAYAILVQDGNILLVKMKATEKYHLPGGGVELGETTEAALHREVSEETGLRVRVDRLAGFEELFFYYDPSGKAYHGLFLYFLCTPLTSELAPEGALVDESTAEPCWVPVEDLSAEDFQHGGEKVLAVCRELCA